MAVTRDRYKGVGRGYLGPIPKLIFKLLTKAWEDGITTSSNYARQNAPQIALAASAGWISNVTLDGKRFTNRWNITAQGVNLVNHQKEMQ